MRVVFYHRSRIRFPPVYAPTVPMRWTLGTALGAYAGELLPTALCASLGIAIYGMFLAIFVPAARDDLGVFFAVATAILCGCILRYVPWFSFLTDSARRWVN